jgi:hypothetical protein
MLWQDIPDTTQGKDKEKSFNFLRRDYLVMVGYNNPFEGTLFEGMGVSVGWKRGEFELGAIERFYGGSSGVSIIPRPMERKSSGPVFAVSYGIPITPVFLGVNLGVGPLTDEFSFLPVEYIDSQGQKKMTKSQTVEKDTLALVAGIRGEVLITDRLSLSLSLDYSKLKGKGYEFETELKTDFGVSKSTTRVDEISETVKTLRASLKWNFSF